MISTTRPIPPQNPDDPTYSVSKESGRRFIGNALPLIRQAVPTIVAAKALGCDASRIRKLVSRGHLEGFKDGAATRIYVDSICMYQQRSPAGRPSIGNIRPGDFPMHRGRAASSDGHRFAMDNLMALGLIKDGKQ